MQDSDLRPLSLGSSSFAALRASNQIYVDKTNLVYSLASGRNKIFLVRPRRFGKSLLASTFESLFKYGLRDFKGLAIEKLWNDKTYDVVHLDFSLVKHFTDAQDFQGRFERYLTYQFGLLGFAPQAEGSVIRELSHWLEQLPVNSLVYIIDEYDAPLTACLHDQALFKAVRSTLNEFFTTVKAQDGCNRFFFMTGITKFSHSGIFSGFNNYTDISLDSQYGTLLGLTQEEIKANFGGYLENASRALNLPPETVLDKLRENYDGYCFDEKATNHVYCPWSVLNFLKAPHSGFDNYWYASAGHPSVLFKYLKNHEWEDPATYAQDKYVDLDLLNASREYDEIDPAVLLTQAGYLTIKQVDPDRIVILDYPNQEVAVSMARLYAHKLLANKALLLPDDPWLPDLFAQGDVNRVIEQLNLVVNAIDYANYPITNEAICRAYVQVLLIGPAMVPHVEQHSALGRSDLEVNAGQFRWIFEFKYADTTQEVPVRLTQALEQIKTQRYGETAHNKKLIRVAIVFCGQTRQFAAFREA